MYIDRSQSRSSSKQTRAPCWDKQPIFLDQVPFGYKCHPVNIRIAVAGCACLWLRLRVSDENLNLYYRLAVNIETLIEKYSCHNSKTQQFLKIK